MCLIRYVLHIFPAALIKTQWEREHKLMDSMFTHKDVQGSNIKNFGIKRSWVTLKTLATLNHHS
jgi:hypothetical protein